VGADFSGADMTNAVVDRVDFRQADLSKARRTLTMLKIPCVKGQRLLKHIVG
jgi:uncharacterized protein YjbI with pentapeptide repeats